MFLLLVICCVVGRIFPRGWLLFSRGVLNEACPVVPWFLELCATAFCSLVCYASWKLVVRLLGCSDCHAWYARVKRLHACLLLPCSVGLLWNVGLLVFFDLLHYVTFSCCAGLLKNSCCLLQRWYVGVFYVGLSISASLLQIVNLLFEGPLRLAIAAGVGFPL